MDVKPTTQIRVNGTFHFGKDVIEFQAENFAEVGTEDFEFARLSSLIVTARKNFIDTLASRLVPVAQQPNTEIVGEQWSRVEQVSKTIDKGKTYIKAHFGRYMQHGINMWEEVLERANIHQNDIPDQPFKPSSMAVRWGTDAQSKPRIVEVRIGDSAESVLNV